MKSRNIFVILLVLLVIFLAVATCHAGETPSWQVSSNETVPEYQATTFTPPIFDRTDPYRVVSYAEARRMVEADSLTGVMVTVGVPDPYVGSVYYHVRVESGVFPGWADGTYWLRQHWDGRVVMTPFTYPINLAGATPAVDQSGAFSDRLSKVTVVNRSGEWATTAGVPSRPFVVPGQDITARSAESITARPAKYEGTGPTVPTFTSTVIRSGGTSNCST